MQNREFEEALLRARELKSPEKEEFKSPEKEEFKSPEKEEFKSPEKEEFKSPEKEEFKSPEKEEFKSPEKEEFKSPEKETAILENERGTKLYKDRLIHEGKTYLVTEMKCASTKAGFMHSLLEIQFKNGKTHSFYVGNLPNTSITIANAKDFKINHNGTDFKEAAEQWASVINALISLS